MQLSQDISHHFELLRMLGHTYYGGADAQEVLQIAANLKPNDDEGWYHEWATRARAVEQAALASAARGHHRSASRGFLRAATYFFMADFYLHGNPADERILASSRASRRCFVAAFFKGSDYSFERIDIPFEGASFLPAYVLRRKDVTGPRPTLIVHSGFDGTKEEIALWPGMAALERGYTVIAFEGPGQGEVIREQRLPFRADWDKVVTPVVDYALGRGDVDGERIALMGISLGGVLAPIAAAKEPRLRALIANGGLYTLHALIRSLYPAQIPDDEAQLAKAMTESAAGSTSIRWLLNHGKYVFAAKDYHDLLRISKRYEAVDAARIACPTLVLDADLEGFFKGQPQILFDKLTCRKTLLRLTVEEAAGAHCQAGAEAVGSQKIFDWLDEAMRVGELSVTAG